MADVPLRCAPLATPGATLVVDSLDSQAAAVGGVVAGVGAPPPVYGAASPPPSRGAGEASPLARLDAEEDGRLKNWKQGESLGKGAYGEVFKAMVAGRFMAVKKIPLDLSLSQKAAEKETSALLAEINTLKRLKHPRIVRYHGCIRHDAEEDQALLIFLEFMPSGSIKAVLDKFGPYGLGLARKYTKQILEGLEFLHSERIVHRDVKGANILIDAQGDAKLADFGASGELESLQSTMTGGMKSIHGSIFWMAPEVMKYKAGRRSDIWSLGCTVIEMVTAEPPWGNLRADKLSVTEMLKRIVEGPESPPLPPKIPQDCKHFLEIVLVRDHARRPYATQLLRHRFALHESGTPSSSGPAAAAKASAEAWGAAAAPAPPA
eukprot:TRINITY_DN18968_c0_g1_i1.p1 TRINITY_DN18968_c0_g1~~TRINITY_DN18968_c0_g1_i1.p1  ORF type:complete len:399 (+),score=84.76 TRINITY_DN18968_c0_g1_i1:68-1198(+)